jgi:ATP-dependent DNA helicase DinG
MTIAPRLLLPHVPALVAGHGRAAILTADGELITEAPDLAAARLAGTAPLLVHAPATFRRLGQRPGPAYDLLELFAFALPARPAAPTARGLALALELDPPAAGLEAEVSILATLATVILRRLAQARGVPRNRDAAGIAARMGQAGWPWAASVLAALGAPDAAPSRDAYRVWTRLPEWEDAAPLPPPAAHPVPPAEARTRLAAMLGEGAEQRPGQADYASAAAAAFVARPARGDPAVVLAEAGTGTGKTLGYVAPASLWAERNQGAVWISTFTRHLQRQIQAELARLAPDEADRRRRFVVRKGRENYLCLLNLEDAVRAIASPLATAVVPLGLVARWALATADGELQGGDLPGWIGELFGAGLLASLADRRGECIYGGCPHWRRCYVEHTIRRARGAQLVIANHALVMSQAVHGLMAQDGGTEETALPGRYVFDEGHHVFDAADGAFAAVLSGAEAAELRRWLLGAEGLRSRSRGLRTRLDDLIGADAAALSPPLDAALMAARALPAPGWAMRLAAADHPELAGVEPGQPNPTEAVLRLFRRQVLARLAGSHDPGPGLHDVDLSPLIDGLPEAAGRLERALARIAEPLATLRKRLLARLEDDAEELDPATRNRIEGSARAILRRALTPLAAWGAMLRDIEADRDPGERPTHLMFLRLDRRPMMRADAAEPDRDVGLHRHWLDPTLPFALGVAAPAQGLLITSATLRDSGDADAETAWAAAETRVGAPHLPSPALRATVASPFDYAAQTRAFIVTDVGPAGGIGALASAYRALFVASGGGALGLFTAIARLRQVHERIAAPLEEDGITLLAQHVDAMDNASLVDIFRTDEHSCLLGTDAMRDGVDVPGRALRLVVFERVPWPRPDILHRERRVHLSGGDPKGYDDRIARLRLRQAFGRLIRRATDRGVFVLLDRQTPSRLLSAFPAGVAPRRVGLAEAVAGTRAFLQAERDG